ncbi:putative protein phosphatase 2C 55 [Platanthera guangdongensis]|uniref:Protein phosphatase n=1 Tax=Platanthera guangdongensis TaxID=2320717 RepID=A0ABR2LM41_9ASPA
MFTSSKTFCWGRNFMFDKAWQFFSKPVSTIGILPQFGTNALKNMFKIHQRSTFSSIGTLSRAFFVPSMTDLHCQSSIYHIEALSSLSSKKYLFGPFQKNIMSVHILSKSESFPESLGTSVRNVGQPHSSMIQVGTIDDYNCSDYSRRINRLLHGQSSRRVSGDSSVWSSKSWRQFQLSRSFSYSTAAAPDASFYGAPRCDQLVDLNRAERSLKLTSGSCYLPHPDKQETGGEDAHFICDNEQVIGVADGVGGWADVGIDAGYYARELMSNSVAAIHDEPQGLIDPTRVLEKAYLNTKAKGSSTACIIALTDQGIHAVNLGDSGFIVVRDGSTIFRSPVQQHSFNCCYQLQMDRGSDLPSSGQVFTFPVESGDVIVAGTDGLFDNLYNDEINAIVVLGTRIRLTPLITAQKIAALARQRALDKNRHTPFSAAAQDAGYRHYGGKLDDITVVVSCITSS